MSGGASGTGGRPPARPGQRLEKTLERLRAAERVGLMTHMVLGYPNLDESYRIVERMARAGADLIEVQIPFSDPTADGPVITAACQKALDGGIRVADAFRFLEEVSGRYEVPFLVMSYFNVVFSYGGDNEVAAERQSGVPGFVERVASAGASGLIVPDIPPERKEEGYARACGDRGIHPIYVVSPNIPETRVRMVSEVASGLIYATTRTGTTGREMELEIKRLSRFLTMLRDLTNLPVALGFSISERKQVEALRGHADVAVVGTHLIRVHERSGLDGLEEEIHALCGK